jgi:hypothetical protein
MQPVGPFHDRPRRGQVARVDPGGQSQAASGAYVQAGVSRNVDRAVDPIKLEALADVTGTEGDVSLPGAVVGTEAIVGVAFPKSRERASPIWMLLTGVLFAGADWTPMTCWPVEVIAGRVLLTVGATVATYSTVP